MYKRRTIVDKMSVITDVIQNAINMILTTKRENIDDMKKEFKKLGLSDEQIEKLISESQQLSNPTNDTNPIDVDVSTSQQKGIEVESVDTASPERTATQEDLNQARETLEALGDETPDNKERRDAAKAEIERLEKVLNTAEGGRRRTKRKGRKGSRKSKKGSKKSKKGAKKSQKGGRRSRKYRRKHSHRRKH
jgi:hypothetical protein